MGKEPQQIRVSASLLERNSAGIPRYLRDLRAALLKTYPRARGFDYKLHTDDGDKTLAGLLTCYSGWAGGFRIKVSSPKAEPELASVEVGGASRAYRFGLICFMVVFLAAIGFILWQATGTISMGGVMFGSLIVALPFLLVGTLVARILAAILGKQGYRLTPREQTAIGTLAVEILTAPDSECDEDAEAEEEET